MDETLHKINTRLQHYNRDELMALIWDFLSDREEDELAEFLDLMRQKSRPAVVETLELEDAGDLLSGIQELHDAIANDEYVEHGSGYDSDYGEYRGIKYALAAFDFPLTGTTDQPLLLVQLPGVTYWVVVTDVGGSPLSEARAIPCPLKEVWGLGCTEQ